jgi:hypothetical protein
MEGSGAVMMIDLTPQQLAQLGALLQAQKASIDELLRDIQEQITQQNAPPAAPDGTPP